MVEDLATKMIEIAEQRPKEECINAIMRRSVCGVIIRRPETNRCGAECDAHYRDQNKYPGESAERPAARCRNVPPPRVTKCDPRLRANNSEQRKLLPDSESAAKDDEKLDSRPQQ